MPVCHLVSRNGHGLDPRPLWLHEDVSWGENLTRKCLKCWNATVGVDEGKNITSANQHLSSTNDGKHIYMYGRT